MRPKQPLVCPYCESEDVTDWTKLKGSAMVWLPVSLGVGGYLLLSLLGAGDLAETAWLKLVLLAVMATALATVFWMPRLPRKEGRWVWPSPVFGCRACGKVFGGTRQRPVRVDEPRDADVEVKGMTCVHCGSAGVRQPVWASVVGCLLLLGAILAFVWADDTVWLAYLAGIMVAILTLGGLPIIHCRACGRRVSMVGYGKALKAQGEARDGSGSRDPGE